MKIQEHFQDFEAENHRIVEPELDLVRNNIEVAETEISDTKARTKNSKTDLERLQIKNVEVKEERETLKMKIGGISAATAKIPKILNES